MYPQKFLNKQVHLKESLHTVENALFNIVEAYYRTGRNGFLIHSRLNAYSKDALDIRGYHVTSYQIM